MYFASSLLAWFPHPIAQAFDQTEDFEKHVKDGQLRALSHASVVRQGLIHLVAEARVSRIIASIHWAKPVQIGQHRLKVGRHQVVGRLRLVNAGTRAAQRLISDEARGRFRGVV